MTNLSSGSLTYQGVSFQFGKGTPFALTGFKRGTAGFRTEDRDRVRRDGRQMGRDLKEGPSHEISLAILGEGETRAEREADARRLSGELATAWNAEAVRSRTGALAELRIGERVARGRPREYTPDDDGLWDGTAEAVLKFDCVDDLWYGEPVEMSVKFAPPVGGGLRFPARAPFRFGGVAAERQAALVVEGERPAWPVFEVRGPVSDPEIDVVGVGRLLFRGVLAYDERLVVDTGAGWVKRGFIGSEALSAAPGALSASGSRLSDFALSPGSYRVLLRGFSPSGLAELRSKVSPVFSSF